MAPPGRRRPRIAATVGTRARAGSGGANTTTALTELERSDFSNLEDMIEVGLDAFVEVGSALSMIRDERLYRETHDTFEDYCGDRWEMVASRARQLISAYKVVDELVALQIVTPTNEGQARALAKVKDPEQRVEVWERVVATAPVVHGKPKITARHVTDVVKTVTAPDPTPGDENNGVPWGDEDKWCWKLKNLYTQAPKRSQNAFRKWFDQQVVIRALSPNPPTKRRLARLSLDDFEHALATVAQVVESLNAELHVPTLTAHMRDQKVRELDDVVQNLLQVQQRIAAADVSDGGAAS